MAVLSSVQHPNIVAVYSCLADAIEMEEPPEDGAAAAAAAAGAGGWDLCFHRVGEGGPQDAAACDVMVLELCDRGGLTNAIRSGTFAARASAASSRFSSAPLPPPLPAGGGFEARPTHSASGGPVGPAAPFEAGADEGAGGSFAATEDVDGVVRPR